MAVSIANQELKLKRPDPKNRPPWTNSNPIGNQPERNAPKEFDIKLDSDFTAWEIDVETHFKYYEQEFANEQDRISWLESILKGKV
jgi:hypothetical protein